MNAAARWSVGRDGTDAIVVGDGVIGLSVALELADRGATVRVFGDSQPGAATTASGGLLAPSVGAAHLPAGAHAFYFGSRNLFPRYLARLQDSALRLSAGLLHVGAEATAGAAAPEARQLDQAALERLEPALGHVPVVVLHPNDGALDPVRLQRALEHAVGTHANIVFERLRVDEITLTPEPAVSVSGTRHRANRVILAAGAWTSGIQGLPTPVPVTPLKGQMIELAACPLKHPVMAEHFYLVPRDQATIAGSTSENVGFDWQPTPAVVAELMGKAATLCPALTNVPLTRAWAGLRPVTPDFLPILGADDRHSALVYAVGHSRNGILLAPATALAIADIVESKTPAWDLKPFSHSRFAI